MIILLPTQNFLTFLESQLINFRLDWYDHVASRKIAQIGGVIYKGKFILPEHVPLIVSNARILPHINYGIIIIMWLSTL